MKPLNELDDNLEIFRFVTFFDLYEILLNRRLRFSKLATFTDNNEGVGWVLAAQSRYAFRHSSISHNAVVDIYKYARNNHFLSCWTLERDLIAMWALYSPDHSSIRISTTVAKLRKSQLQVIEKYSFGNAWERPGSRELVAWFGYLGEVDYVDFFKIRDDLQNKYQAFHSSTFPDNVHSLDYFSTVDFQSDVSNYDDDSGINNGGSLLKDRAYMHEHELRAVLCCGVRNEKTRAECETSVMTEPFVEANENELPNYIYAEVDDNFIETICFDPRMPAYKRKVFEAILVGQCPEIKESKAFGCAIQQASFASDFDGNPA